MNSPSLSLANTVDLRRRERGGHPEPRRRRGTPQSQIELPEIHGAWPDVNALCNAEAQRPLARSALLPWSLAVYAARDDTQILM
jgi:hypothetical protein